MLFLVRPLAARCLSRSPDQANPGKALSAWVLIFVFLCALATEIIGIHALFGAFLAGAVMPNIRAFRNFLRERLEYSSSLFLLPVFFASASCSWR